MKASMSRTEDSDTLQDLGRASIQIVHDLKNQLNGLKLYATFLRRRIEKSDRPDDERETIGKLIGGLDRAASDLSTIVQYGRQIELKKQPGFDLSKVLRNICSSFKNGNSPIVYESALDSMQGDFDHSRLTDALKWISVAAIKNNDQGENGPEVIRISARLAENDETKVIVEWSGLRQIDHDPFLSFAGSDEIRLSLAAKIIEAHGGSANHVDRRFLVVLPLSG